MLSHMTLPADTMMELCFRPWCLRKVPPMFDCFDYVKDIGQICNEVPFDLTYAGDFAFLPVATEKSFHIYGAADLKLKGEGTSHAETITHIASDANYVYTATEHYLRSTYRQSNIHTEIRLDEEIIALVPCGEFVVAATSRSFTGYGSKKLDEKFSIDTEKNISAICHPFSYINKFIVAFDDCTMQLWNVNKGELLYEFEGFDAPVTKIIQSTVIDIIAFICTDAKVILHNVKTNETLFSLQHSDPVTDLFFRTDGPAHLVAGLANGDIILWDLNDLIPIYKVAGAHNGPITCVCGFRDVNQIITGGADNAIRQWVIDPNSTKMLHVIRSRVGHSEPPSAIGFSDINGTVELITTSGTSRVISTNPYLETTAQILSTRPLNKNHLVAPIKHISTTNSLRFASLATQHEDSSLVLLWEVDNHRFGGRALPAAPHHGACIQNDQALTFAMFHEADKATAVFLTKCGNFAVIGTSSGAVLTFISQSARFKGATDRPHESPVVLVHVDALNARLTSASEDGLVLFHDFNTRGYIGQFILEAPVRAYAEHPNSTLLAIAHGENLITVLDTATRKVARRFEHEASNLCFTHDGKFLLAAGSEPVARLFDLITATLVEEVVLEEPVVGFAAHPHGDFIASIHSGKVATKLWKFVPSKIRRVISGPALESADHSSLAVFSRVPFDKIKRIVEPPTDPLKFPKARKQVPFFLGAAADIGRVSLLEELTEDGSSNSSRPSTDFTSLLINGEGDGYIKAFEAIKTMTLDSINTEIMALGISDEGDERLLFVKMLIAAVNRRTDFDLTQALIHSFLSEHAYKASEDLDIRAALRELLTAQEAAVNFLEDDIPHATALIQMLNRIQ